MVSICFSIFRNGFAYFLFSYSIDVCSRQWDAEPNNMDGNEDCTILLNGGLFGDVNCARKEFYICEKSVSGTH